jgi:hypothetical protein
VMANRDKASPEGLRKEIMSAVIGLDLVVEWFDIGFGMVVNGLISIQLVSGILQFFIPQCSDTQATIEDIFSGGYLWHCLEKPNEPVQLLVGVGLEEAGQAMRYPESYH